jgi:hypothetical protein
MHASAAHLQACHLLALPARPPADPASLPWLQVMQCIDKDSEGRVKKHDLM